MRGAGCSFGALRVALCFFVLSVFPPLAHGSDAYIGAYNTLVQILAERCLAVGVTTNDIPEVDPATGTLTQTRLNNLRSKVLSLIDTKYLVPPEFFALDKSPASEAFYSSRSRLMAGIGDGRRFTKVPADYTADGAAIYAESFTDVPPLWIHFTELHEALQRLRFTLITCVWTNYDGSAYHDNGRGCTWQSASTWGRVMQLADQAYAADEAGVAQGNPRSITRGYVTGSGPYVYYADRSRAFFFAKVTNLPAICPRRAHFYNYATKPDPKWASGMLMYQQFSNTGEPYVRENLWTLWDSSDATSTPDVYSRALAEGAYADWCQRPDIARRYSHSGFLVTDKRAVIEWLFETPPLMNPCAEDSECDGVTVDICDCGPCLPEPHLEWQGASLGVNATLPLGWSDGSLTAGVRVGAGLTEYFVDGTVRHMFNLETRILSKAVDPGGKWEFVQIKRPGGTEVVFALKGRKAGWPVGMTKPYRLVKSGGDYELHFGGPLQVVHRFEGSGGQLKEVRVVVEHQPVAVQGTPEAWPGLNLQRSGGKIVRVEWPSGITELARDERGRVVSVTYRDLSGTVFRRVTMDDGQDSRRYRIFSGTDELNTEARVTVGLPGEVEIWRGVSADGQPLWRQRRIAFGNTAAKLASLQEVTSITGSVASKPSVSSRRYVFGDFPWGTELTSVIEGEETAQPQTTTWEYYTDPADASNYGRIRLVQYPNGYWVRYEYDSQGRTKIVYRPFKNAGPEAGPHQCRVTRYFYAGDPVLAALGFPAGDLAVVNDRRPRLEVEEVQAREVARTYRAYLADQHVVQRCLEANALYDATSNIVTVTRMYTSGQWTGRPRQVLHPDGTTSLYQYEYDPLRKRVTEVRRTGISGNHGVTNGVETVRVLNAAGEVLSEVERDILSGITTAARTYTRDAFGRETMISNVLEGTWREIRYGCCGPELVVDEHGLATWRVYDPLGREQSVTRLGITEEHVYDVFENVVQTRKTSTDGLERLTRMTFDAVNRILSVSNELGSVTRYGYGVGQEGETTTTMTLPNGAIMVETRFRDGQVKSRVGSAVNPVCWDYGVDAEGMYSIEYRGANTSATEWIRMQYDRLGRLVKLVYPDGYIRRFAYDPRGRLLKESDGFSTRLLAYDELGRVRQEVVDMDGNGQVDLAGADRVTARATRYVLAEGKAVQETLVWVYPKLGISERLLVEVRRTALDGSGWWMVAFGRTNRAEIVRSRADRRRTETFTAPDGTYTANVYSNDWLVITKTVGNTGELVAEMSKAYDGFG
ncbi:MAG: hypothetical protein N2255_02970, partial [Kiritimatiellae bacterium]|nr:hypothetical protein [Kiritimatiellia bacterium]